MSHMGISIGKRRVDRRSERGSMVAMAAIGALAFLLAAGLAIDISHVYLVGTELQNAADAAAVAAASSLNSGASGIHEAVDRAVAPMNSYEFNKTGVLLDRQDVRFAVNLSEFDNGGTGRSEATAAASPENIRFVKVTISPKSVRMLFAHLALNANAINLSREAVAGHSVPPNVICNVLPLTPLQDDLTGAPLDVNPECPNRTAFTPGCTYTIRRPSGNSPSPGNYLLLALTGRGGSDDRTAVAIGADTCYRAGDIVTTKPGVTAGPIRQGMDTRFDDYSSGLSPDDYPPDTNIKTGITYAQYVSDLPAYQQSPTHPGVANRRVFLMPIINQSEFDSGRDRARIAGFGVFFMQDKVSNGNGGDIRAEFISHRVVVGDGAYDPNAGPGTAQAAVPVLYR